MQEEPLADNQEGRLEQRYTRSAVAPRAGKPVPGGMRGGLGTAIFRQPGETNLGKL